jgi:hypothetical protein
MSVMKIYLRFPAQQQRSRSILLYFIFLVRLLATAYRENAAGALLFSSNREPARRPAGRPTPTAGCFRPSAPTRFRVRNKDWLRGGLQREKKRSQRSGSSGEMSHRYCRGTNERSPKHSHSLACISCFLLAPMYTHSCENENQEEAVRLNHTVKVCCCCCCYS